MTVEDSLRTETATGNASEVGFGKPPAQHRFQKGQSGNPGGRPKGLARLTRELFDGALDETIIRFWATVMSGQRLPDGREPTVSHSLEASKLLAAYGWGKAPEFGPVEDADPLEIEIYRALSDERAVELAQIVVDLEPLPGKEFPQNREKNRE